MFQRAEWTVNAIAGHCHSNCTECSTEEILSDGTIAFPDIFAPRKVTYELSFNSEGALMMFPSLTLRNRLKSKKLMLTV